MSVVAAMTLDDQRPLLNNYDKMSKQYEQNLTVGGGGGGGLHNAAPPSGPASPTPSGSEEPPTAAQQQHSYHHHPHHHHHHHSSAASSMHQQQYQHQAHHHNHHQTTTTSSLTEQQQQQQKLHQLHEQQQQQLQIESQQQQQLQQAQQQESSVVVVAEAVAAAEQRQRLLEDEIESLKLEQSRLAQQCNDAQRREKILMRRLANKEQEFQDYVTQIAEYKAAQAPSAIALRSAMLDPAVNLLFEKLKKELKATKAKLEETENELSAWKFTPDSNTGKRLMAKCRLLYQENEELGKMTSNGRLAKLETELAMQKSFSEEVKKSQYELDDFLQELDEDVEGMQSTILFLQQELKTTRERIQTLEKENYQLKNNDLKELDLVETNSNNNGDSNTTTQLNSTQLNSTLLNSTSSNANSPLNSNNIQLSNNELQNVAPYQTNYQKLTVPSAAFGGNLEPIDENECLRTTHAAVATKYYNGALETTIAGGGGTPPAVLAHDDSNSSNNSALQLRTLASRKRNFDESSSVTSGSPTECLNATAVPMLPTNAPIQQTAMQQQQVSSPRTLPPKKSKLRLTASNSTEQLNEISMGSSDGYNVNSASLGASATPVMDNAVVGMANEELLLTTNENHQEVIPQRIMTRRRSVRMQQNGNGDVSH